MKKWQEFMVFIVVYLTAILIGLYSLRYVDGPFWFDVFVFDIVMTLVVYFSSLMVKNASLYDPYWSVIPPLLILYAMIQLDAFGLVNVIMLLALSVWAVRLTYNWAINWTSFSHQDWRYDLIKQKTKQFYPLSSLFAIMLLPTVVVYAQVYVSVAVIKTNASLTLFSVLPALVILAGTMIQYVADKQMKNFREKRSQKRVIDIGLWQYSRHPNYLGEIIVWWGMYGFYIAVVGKLDFLILAPILMTMLFLGISIPMMEKKILKTRPEYRAYQKQTSMLICLPKRQVREPIKNR